MSHRVSERRGFLFHVALQRFEIASVLVRFDRVALLVVDANHGIVPPGLAPLRAKEKLTAFFRVGIRDSIRQNARRTKEGVK